MGRPMDKHVRTQLEELLIRSLEDDISEEQIAYPKSVAGQ